MLPPDGVVCDRSAAWLGASTASTTPSTSSCRTRGVVDRRQRTGVRRGELLVGKRDLRDDEICEVGGIRVTTPLRTACDLACLRGRNAALAIYDAFRREHGLTCADFERMLCVPRPPRVKQARELAPYAVASSESPASRGPG